MAKLKVYNISLKFNKIIKIFLIILILIIVLKLISNKVQAIDNNNNIIKTNINKVSNASLNNYLEKTISVLSLNKENNNKINLSSKNILKYELSTLNKIIEETDFNIDENNFTTEDKAELLQYEKVSTEVQESTVTEIFSEEIENVKIKNTSSYEITNETLNDLKNNNSTYSRNILIFHTHTCESYTESENFKYTPTSNYRTTDLDFSVARVGSELENYLKNLKFNVIHDKTYHDFPSYSGSYNRSYETVQSLKNENPDYEIIFDIHRDAVGSDGSYAPTVKIGDDYAAQLMFVIGTDAGGLEHPLWKNNLSFAIKVQSKANELYPGLFKPIMISDSRFNQNLGTAACIIEVGATGNTLDEAINSMKYLSIILDNII